jgi:cytoskeleton protein RodZ
LDLDPEDAVKRFKQEAAGLHARTQLSFPSPAPEGKVPGAGVMVAAAVLAALAYGGWYVMSERGMTLDDMVPAVPERLAELITSDPATAPLAEITTPEATGTRSGSGDAPATTSTYAQANPDGSTGVDRRAISGVQAPTSTTDAEATDALSTPPAATVTGGSADTSSNTQAQNLANTPANTPIASATEQRPAISTQDVAPEPTAIEPRRPVSSGAPREDMPRVARAPIPPVGQADAPRTAIPTTESAAAASSASAQAEASSATTTATASSDSSAPSSLVASSEAAVPGAPDLSTPPSAPAIPAAPGLSTGAINIPDTGVVVRATGDSWVQIKDPSGNTLFTRVLNDGDIYRVPNQSGLTLDTGNAGTLSILVDGKAIPSLGGFGDVVRNIGLDPASLKARATSAATQPATQPAPGTGTETTPRQTVQ